MDSDQEESNHQRAKALWSDIVPRINMAQRQKNIVQQRKAETDLKLGEINNQIQRAQEEEKEFEINIDIERMNKTQSSLPFLTK